MATPSISLSVMSSIDSPIFVFTETPEAIASSYTYKGR